MRRFALIAISALTLSACSESLDPTSNAPVIQKDIILPGNENICEHPFDGSCFPPLDYQVKVLYEGNNTYAKLGEADYDIASRANDPLASIFYGTGVTQSKALQLIDSYLSKITVDANGGAYSTCAAASAQARAAWIRDKIATNNYDLTGAPEFARCVSPLTGMTAVRNATTGEVTASAKDPYHYAFGTPYGDGTQVGTYFVWQRSVNGSAWVTVDSSATIFETPPSTPPTRSFVDTNVTADTIALTYSYRVKQCDAYWATIYLHTEGCSPWTSASVTLAALPKPPVDDGGGEDPPPPPPACLNHDNSNHDPATNNNKNKDKCDKDPPGQVKKNS